MVVVVGVRFIFIYRIVHEAMYNVYGLYSHAMYTCTLVYPPIHSDRGDKSHGI